MVRLAHFSEDRKYRYRLLRLWDESKPIAMCIGLNPSTANEEKDDRTISFLTESLGELGFGSFFMMNLYAFVASKPEILLAQPDKLGDNDKYIVETAKGCHQVIYCWGAWDFISVRAKHVIALAPNGKCFGKTKHGYPFHPMAFVRRGIKQVSLTQF
jgi:hypothetical protein